MVDGAAEILNLKISVKLWTVILSRPRSRDLEKTWFDLLM